MRIVIGQSLLLRALLVSVLLNLQYLLHYLRDPGTSPVNFTDIDEIVYLQLPFFASAGLSSNAYYAEWSVPQSLLKSFAEHPPFAIDFLLGHFARALGFGPVELGLALDLVLPAVAFVLFVRLFELFSERRGPAQLAALMLLARPWDFALDQWFLTPIPWFSSIVSSSIGMNGSVPILRGIYTQISYPLFALGLLLAFSLLNGTRPRRSASWAFVGMICGLQFYFYFFAWGSSIAVIPSCIALAALVPWSPVTKQSAGGSIRAILAFLSCNLLVAIPGVWIATKSKPSLGNSSDLLSQFWYFSIEVLISFLFFAGLLLRARRLGRSTALYSVVLACLLSQIVLMNLQPLLNVALAPYHFPQLYLQPLVGGCIMLLLAQLPYLRGRLPVVLAAIVLTVVGASNYLGVRSLLRGESDEFSELVTFIRESTEPDSVLAMMTMREPFRAEVPRHFSIRPDPNAIATLANRKLLHQDWVISNELLVDSLKRELALGWFFSGKVQLLWPCIEHLDSEPGDLFNLTWSYYLQRRLAQCLLLEEVESYDICGILQDYRTDYLIAESFFDLPESPLVDGSVLPHVWSSSSQTYAVYRFNKEEALTRYCSNKDEILNGEPLQ